MKSLLGETDEQVKQTFDLYEKFGKLLHDFCQNVEDGDEPLNLTCLATSMGMVLNDICQELENDGADDVREHVVGQMAKFVFLNKRMSAH